MRYEEGKKIFGRDLPGQIHVFARNNAYFSRAFVLFFVSSLFILKKVCIKSYYLNPVTDDGQE